MTRWSEPDVGFRPLTVGDLPLLYDWLGREHVRRWWGEPGPTTTRQSRSTWPRSRAAIPPTSIAIVVAGEDVGLIQTYLLADYPDYAALVDAGDEAAGLDLFLGEARLTGSGLGTVRDPHVRLGGRLRPRRDAGLRRRPGRPQPRLDPRVREGRLHGRRRRSSIRRTIELHAVMRLDRPR